MTTTAFSFRTSLAWVGSPTTVPVSNSLTSLETEPNEYRFQSDAVVCQPWLDSLRQRVEELLSLSTNWNGYGDSRIHPSAISRALAIIDRVGRTEEPWLVPLANGHVQLEWYADDQDVIVEVPPEGYACVFAGDQPCVQLGSDRGLDALSDALDRLYT